MQHWSMFARIRRMNTTNAETDTSFDMHEIERALQIATSNNYNAELNNEHQHDEALKYYERALQIKQRATTNAELVDVCKV